MGDMQGKVALVTGASSGIGRSTAKLFAERGASVVVAARRMAELESLVAEIQASGGQAKAVETDVSRSADVQALVSECVSAFGRLDYAVNNAGVEGDWAPVTELPEEEWDRIMAINLKGPYLCMKYEATAMLEAGNGGAIVNVGSVNSFLGFQTISPYAASKHGLVGLTSSASAELAPQGIRVNIVCPGIIDTPMHHRARKLVGDEVYDQAVLPTVHLRRAGQPEEIARSILFLCSDDASYVTGTTLTPDGGFTLTI